MQPAQPAQPVQSERPETAGAPPPSPDDSVWARPGPGATRERAPAGERTPPGEPGEPGEPGATAPIGRERHPDGPPPAPRRRPPRTPLIVAGGIALLLVAVVAMLTLRGAGGTQPTASPGTATFAPGAPGANGSGGAPNRGGDTTGGSGAPDSTGSLRLPDRVGGMARIPTDAPSLLQGQAGILDLVTRTGALDGWGLGAYGPNADEPRFVIMVVRAKETSSADVLAGGMAGGVRNSLGGATSSRRTITRGGVRYDCWNASAGSVCSFQSGPTVGVGFTRDGNLDRLSQLSDDARRGVRG